MMTTYDFASAWLQARCKTDRGASLVEYALLVALIAVVCIVAVTLLGKSASSKFSAGGLLAQLVPSGFERVKGRATRSAPLPFSVRRLPWRHRRATHRGSWPGRCRGDAGAGLVEYALLLALIVVACIGAVTFLGGNLSSNLSSSNSKITTAGP